MANRLYSSLDEKRAQGQRVMIVWHADRMAEDG
jgi:hypothetical protein